MKTYLQNIEAHAICDKISAHKDVKARINVSYDFNNDDVLLINYHIIVSDRAEQLYSLKCSYKIIEYDRNLPIVTVLEAALESLKSRIEMIIAIIAEEMKIDIQGC